MNIKKSISELYCTNGNHSIDGLCVEEGTAYVLKEDNYGEFFEDEKGNEHYLADLNWDSNFAIV